MDDIICSLPDDLKNVLSNKKLSSRWYTSMYKDRQRIILII